MKTRSATTTEHSESGYESHQIPPRVFDDPPQSPSTANASVSAPRSAAAAGTGIDIPALAMRGAARPIIVTEGADRPATATSADAAIRQARRADAAARSSIARSPTASTVRSRRSTASAAARIKQAEYDAACRLADTKKKELQLDTELIRKRLEVEIACIEAEESTQGSVAEGSIGERVGHWLQNNDEPAYERAQDDPSAPRQDARGEKPGPVSAPLLERRRQPETSQLPMPREPRSRAVHATAHRDDQQRAHSRTSERGHSSGRAIEQLAGAIERLTHARPPPPRQAAELPSFSGAATEWLPFKAAIRDSTALYGFAPAENLARLRSCLKGEAREAVAALLYTATDPDMIMKTLEQCYGRPEIIIDRALEDIKRLHRPTAAASDLNTFAVKVQNIVCVLASVDNRGYLQNPMLTREVVEKQIGRAHV